MFSIVLALCILLRKQEEFRSENDHKRFITMQ